MAKICDRGPISSLATSPRVATGTIWVTMGRDIPLGARPSSDWQRTPRVPHHPPHDTVGRFSREADRPLRHRLISLSPHTSTNGRRVLLHSARGAHHRHECSTSTSTYSLAFKSVTETCETMKLVQRNEHTTRSLQGSGEAGGCTRRREHCR